MSELKHLMKFRENITHFTNKAPDKKTINQILIDAHELIPVKNNMWNYSIDVWGPEHEKEKKILAMQTVTGLEKRIFAKGGPEEGNIAMLEDIYTEWKASRESQRNSWFTGKGKYRGFGFNDQVTAPYLLVYYQKPGRPTQTQIEQGYDAKQISYSDNSQHQWLISASMHAYGTTLLCAEQGLYASFCKCYYLIHKNLNNVLHPLVHGFHNVAFLLGIGYRDQDMPYFKNKRKPTVNEIVTWK
jgi:nitroreductase